MKNVQLELAGELVVKPNVMFLNNLEVPFHAWCDFQTTTSIKVTCDKSYKNGKFPKEFLFLFNTNENYYDYYADYFLVNKDNIHYAKFAKSIVDGYRDGADKAVNENNESLKEDFLRIADLFEKRFENILNGKPYYYSEK